MTSAFPQLYGESPLQVCEQVKEPEFIELKPMAGDFHALGNRRLEGKVAIITGADSSIGRSIAILFAKEGADVCIVYSHNHDEAEKTVEKIEGLGHRVIQFEGDIAQLDFCAEVIQRTLNAFGRIDILANNADEQNEIEAAEDIKPEPVEKKFSTNTFGFLNLTTAIIPHLKADAMILNSIPIKDHAPARDSMDCAGTKTEMLDFTRTLAKQLAQKKIRVNAIAHGSISTSRASANFRLNDTITFDERRSPQHCHPSADVASAFLFVAAESGFANNTGQIFRVDGGREI